MTHALAAHAVSAPTTDGVRASRTCRSTAAVLLRGAVVALCTLTVWAQATWVAEADATLVSAIAMETFRAVGLDFGLALAVTLERDGDGQGVLKTHRLDDEGFLLLFGATASSGLHTEGNLKKKQKCDYRVIVI